MGAAVEWQRRPRACGGAEGLGSWSRATWPWARRPPPYAIVPCWARSSPGRVPVAPGAARPRRQR